MIADILLANFRQKKILRHIPKNGIVGDIGCGPRMELLLSVKDKINEGWAIDKKTIQETLPENLHTIEQDLDKNPILALPDNKFDCLIMTAVLEHLALPEEVLKEVFRLLKPGAVLLLTTPSPSAKKVLEFLAFRLRLISKDEILDHKHYFSKQELYQILTEAGFTKIEHHYFELGLNQFVAARK